MTSRNDGLQSDRGWLDDAGSRDGSDFAAPASGIVASLTATLEEERARWFYWVPVALGIGISAYFALPFEPNLSLPLLTLGALAALRLAVPRKTILPLSLNVLLLMVLGFTLIAGRTAWVAAPVLLERIGPVQVRGYIELIEAREGRGNRVTIRVSELAGVDEGAQPRRVRIRTMRDGEQLQSGDAVTAVVHLAPPAGPAIPGGFDFARHAFYSGIGGVGYTMKPLQRDTSATGIAPLDLRIGAGVQRIRQAIGHRIDAVLTGDSAAIAKALITGERGGISEKINSEYRDSGIFHILSISGLHMAIMGGAVFWTVRLLLALFPSVALRYPVKKWAALAAALGSLAYLMISGTSFATVRSFITISIMFFAILFDRPAIALRNVALSAIIILLMFPESLLDVGFQMSFAAVVALVAAYEFARDRYEKKASAAPGVAFKAMLFFGGIVLTTLVASAAVTPFAIYQFHKTQQYAVLANLLAVPICNFVVMPAALATLITIPFGLEKAPVWLMGQGIDAMSWTAHQVAGLPGAVGVLPAISTSAFALIVVGGLWISLWQTRWRILGTVAIAVGIAIAPFMARPDALIGRDGQLVAVRTASGRLAAVAAPQSNFELTRWLEHDGDNRPARVVAADQVLDCDALGCTAKVKGTKFAISRHPASLRDDCSSADVVVLSVPAPKSCPHPSTIIDFFAARTRGTHAIYIDGAGKIRIETVAALRGIRPWSPQHPWSEEGRRHANAQRRLAHNDNPGHATSRIRQFAAPTELLDALRQPRPEIDGDFPAGDAPD